MRNEDYDRELLAGVALICTTVSVIAAMFDTSPTTAKAVVPTPVRAEQIEPVRVVGTPFVPNIDPSVRLAKD